MSNLIKALGTQTYGSTCGEIIESSGGLRHSFTILLKNFYLFKIAETVINFCLKFFSN